MVQLINDIIEGLARFGCAQVGMSYPPVFEKNSTLGSVVVTVSPNRAGVRLANVNCRRHFTTEP